MRPVALRGSRSFISSPRPVAVDLRRDANELAGSPLRVVLLIDCPAHGRLPRGGRQKFFLSISFNVALSMTSSASSFFSLRFSSSSAFRRLASEISRPPNFDFQA